MEICLSLAVSLLFIFVPCIILAFIPYPRVVHAKIVYFFSRLIYPFLFLVGFLVIIFFQQFGEQKINKRKINDAKGTDDEYTFTADYYKFQRNMYATLSSIVCVVALCVVSKTLNLFLQEQKLLNEQLSVRQQMTINRPLITNKKSSFQPDDVVNRLSIPASS